jgi:hypothetical protein
VTCKYKGGKMMKNNGIQDFIHLEETIPASYNDITTKSIMMLGSLTYFCNKKFNKLQKFLWKICFNVIITDYKRGDDNEI